MKKLKLDAESLTVTTFTAGVRPEMVLRGTLRGHDAGLPATIPCLTGTETRTCPTSAATCPACAIGE